MTSLVLGTAGHVDHGKTTLVHALTGIDTDRLREEKERGLTIDIGFAHLDLAPDVRAGIVDVPGHHDFLTNMLAGSTGIDAVLLVVAAHEGPMPQTREHLQIAALLGLHSGVIALTHADRVDGEFAELAAAAAQDDVLEIIGQRWPVVRVDSTREVGLDELRSALLRLARDLPVPTDDPVFRLPVDRSFTIAGAGTVVTGTVWSGSVATGARVRVLPADREARVRSLQAHGEEQREVGPRRRCAASLVGLSRDEVVRGDTLVSDPAWRPVHRLGVVLRLLPGDTRPVEHGQRLRLFLGTGETMARVAMPRERGLGPGESASVVLDCESPVVARAGDPFILRFYSPIELLGGGRVGELDPPRKWRDRTEDWEICLGPSAAESAAAALRLAGARGYTVDELRLAMPHRAPAALPEDWRAVRIGERWFDPDQLTRMCGELLSWLDRAHVETPLESGVALQALRAAVGRDAAAELVEEAIRRLADRGEIVIDGPRVRSAGFQVELLDDQVAARDALMEAISGAGLMPPTPPDLAASIAVPRPLVNDLLNLLVESGSLVRITPDLLLTETAERELRDTALGVLRRLDEPSPADFRTALGVTRRYLIPMLEYLDGIGWTERSAGGRVPGPAARVAIGEPQDG